MQDQDVNHLHVTEKQRIVSSKSMQDTDRIAYLEKRLAESQQRGNALAVGCNPSNASKQDVIELMPSTGRFGTSH